MLVCAERFGLGVLAVVLGVALAVLAVAGGAASSATEGRAQGAAVRALLLADDAYSYPGRGVRITSLAGKQLQVPARVRSYPLGLSPDGHLVAGSPSGFEVASEAVKIVLGEVRGGPMNTILEAECKSSSSADEPVCDSGADPSLAWGPNGQRLAVAANAQRAPTLLKLFDRSGRVVRSFTLPRYDAEQGGRAYFEVDSWSPDGSRLLLLRSSPYVPTAYQALEIKTGKLRTLVDAFMVHGGGSPAVRWSPNGSLVASISDDPYEGPEFRIVDVASGRAIVQCESSKACKKWQPLFAGLYPVWEPHSQGFFARSGNSIIRIGLDGRRTNVISPVPTSTEPVVAFGNYLVYQTWKNDRGSLFLLNRNSGHRSPLGRGTSGMVRPLTRIP